jgi:hypothetical protein
VPTSRSRFSGSPRIGIKTRSQAHSPLESNIDFRLTFGLENADRVGDGRMCRIKRRRLGVY